ncbi:MAG: hypothetical protein PHQ75_03865 [Thermoguttaceae bacterium]|nr:hypothetical protein [Thermoguttaceae bacterium]
MVRANAATPLCIIMYQSRLYWLRCIGLRCIGRDCFGGNERYPVRDDSMKRVGFPPGQCAGDR